MKTINLINNDSNSDYKKKHNYSNPELENLRLLFSS